VLCGWRDAEDEVVLRYLSPSLCFSGRSYCLSFSRALSLCLLSVCPLSDSFSSLLLCLLAETNCTAIWEEASCVGDVEETMGGAGGSLLPESWLSVLCISLEESALSGKECTLAEEADSAVVAVERKGSGYFAFSFQRIVKASSRDAGENESRPSFE